MRGDRRVVELEDGEILIRWSFDAGHFEMGSGLADKIIGILVFIAILVVFDWIDKWLERRNAKARQGNDEPSSAAGQAAEHPEQAGSDALSVCADISGSSREAESGDSNVAGETDYRGPLVSGTRQDAARPHL